MDNKVKEEEKDNGIKLKANGLADVKGLSFRLPTPCGGDKNKRFHVTKKEMDERFPAKKKLITKQVIDFINDHANEAEFDGYTLVDAMTANQNALNKLGTGVSFIDYINSIRFCAFLHSKDSATEAYIKTFWYRDFVKKGVEEKARLGDSAPAHVAIRSAAARFKTHPMVQDILRMSLLETHLSYMVERKGAFGVLADRMFNSKLDRDKIAAADMLLKHTAPPIDTKIDIDIGVKDNINVEMMESIKAAVEMQKQQLQQGANIVDIQKLGIKSRDEDDIIDLDEE